jgi:hypothetical protein
MAVAVGGGGSGVKRADAVWARGTEIGAESLLVLGGQAISAPEPVSAAPMRMISPVHAPNVEAGVPEAPGAVNGQLVNREALPRKSSSLDEALTY